MIPIPFARGTWELLAPWATDVVADVSYTCIALRSFKDVQAEGINIFTAYYEPKGLAQSVYDTDRVNATMLVTLDSDEHGQIIVPTTYIKTAPTTVSSGFNRMVMGVDIGVLPDTLDLSYVNEEIKGLFSALTGLTDVTVTMYTAPITGTLTPEQAEAFEENRKAAIAGRTTFYAKVAQLQAELDTQKQINAAYEKIIVDNGLVTS